MSISRENADWLTHLHSSGAERDQAIQDLFAWLQKRLFFYLRERRDLRQFHDQELWDLSQDFAQESVLILLRKLDQFQGRSRFTTWAAKIAVHQALGELRRARWRDVSLHKCRPRLALPMEIEPTGPTITCLPSVRGFPVEAFAETVTLTPNER